MLPNIFPETIRLSDFDPFLAGQSQYIVGKMALSALSRLRDTVLNPVDELSIELTIGKDDGGYRYIKGQISVEMVLQCQRCLDSVTLPVEAEFCLSPVANDKVELPVRYEPVILDEDSINVIELVADELLLNMPMIARHPEDNCPGTEWLKANQEQVREETHPFKILKKQLK